MAPAVFVWPIRLMAGMHADLHGTSEDSGYDIVHNAELEFDGDHSVRASIIFDLPPSLSQEGRTSLEAHGERYPGVAEAERSAALAMFGLVRRDLHIFPADFNCIALAENRALFNAMSVALESSRAAYWDMDMAIKECVSGLGALRRALSQWIGEWHLQSDSSDIVAVSAFHACLGFQETELRREVVHETLSVDMMLLRDIPPEGQAVLDATVPEPMAIDWERSYFMLRSIYNEAIKKIRGVPSEIRLVQMPDGMFKATIDITAEPYSFWGATSETIVGAKAKVLYVAIKYANVTLGHPIIDLHYEVRHFQDRFIRHFDRKMKGVRRCAERLQTMLDNTGIMVSEYIGELSVSASDHASIDAVFDAIHAFGIIYRAKQEQFQQYWARLDAAQTDRAALEASIAAQA